MKYRVYNDTDPQDMITFRASAWDFSALGRTHCINYFKILRNLFQLNHRKIGINDNTDTNEYSDFDK